MVNGKSSALMSKMMARLVGKDGKPIKPLPHPIIVVMSGDQVQTDFALSLAAMTLVSKSGGLCAVRDSLPHNGRNLSVVGVRQLKGTHLMFLDSDMKFPAETMQRLLSYDVDIVGATYPRRVEPHNLLYKLLPGTGRIQIDDGIIEVASLPTGCMLINMRVFDKLEEPYFRLPSWTQGELIPEALRYYVNECDQETGMAMKPTGLGEDHYFCAMARAAGFKIWLDVGLSPHIGHVGQQIWHAGTAPVETSDKKDNYEPSTGVVANA